MESTQMHSFDNTRVNRFAFIYEHGVFRVDQNLPNLSSKSNLYDVLLSVVLLVLFTCFEKVHQTGTGLRSVVFIIPGNQGNGVENWGLGSVDQAVWATEEDYGVWNRENSVDPNSNSNYDERQSQTRSGSEPPNKKSRNAQSGDLHLNNRSKAIGKMFFKTKLCCKFCAGTCPYITNCNFAHSIEELRRPPPNWQEIVAAHEEERGVSSEPREEFQIPTLGSTAFPVETQRSSKGRHCKKFFTEEGCPYGDNCTFLHDEHSRARESVAISLGPGSGSGYGGGASAGGNGGSPSTLKPSNWKTRICNKWEQTGYCPFGNKCHFAHGAAELHRYGGGLVEGEGKDWSSPLDAKQGVAPSKSPADTIVSSVASVPQSDIILEFHCRGCPMYCRGRGRDPKSGRVQTKLI